IATRTSFYVERGFDPSMTGFPAEAFGEGLDIANLRSDPPPIVRAYGPPVPASENDEEEIGLATTNQPQDWLLRMERLLRTFIDEILTAQHGASWPKHRLPNGLHDEWLGKKADAERYGAQTQRLIDYADFTDYVRIITKKDNWPYFAPFFGRIEDIRESLQ